MSELPKPTPVEPVVAPTNEEPGVHPIGAGAGALIGNVVLGAAGLVAGPIGLVVGAVVGTVVGAIAGNSVTEAIKPTDDEQYWRDNFPYQPYASGALSYDDVAPAYRYGWEQNARYLGKTFAAMEPALRLNWQEDPGHRHLSWEQARGPVRDAWEHAAQRHPEG